MGTNTRRQAGFSLFEVLVAISVFAVVGVLAAQLIGISFQSEKASAFKTVALSLAQETAEAADAIAQERWQGVYGLSKGAANHYYVTVNAGKWATSTGDELITANGMQYRRYFYVENVSRDATTKDIESTYTASRDDPSTQKVTAVASWEDASGLTLGSATTTVYLMRARNTAASQTQWAASGGTMPATGEDADFGTAISASSNMDFSVSGELKLQ